MKPTTATPDDADKVTLTLSTGYAVELDLLDAQAGLEHLAAALIGEIMVPKGKAADDSKNLCSWTPALQAVLDEIVKITDSLAQKELRFMALAVVSAYLMRELDRPQRQQVSLN